MVSVKFRTDPACYNEVAPLTSGLGAIWLIAIAFGIAFWTLLIPAVTTLLFRVVSAAH